MQLRAAAIDQIAQFVCGNNPYSALVSGNYRLGMSGEKRMDRPNFIVDTENFLLIQDEVGIGKIKELSNQDASLLAPHIDGHPDTLYVASSGINLAGEVGLFNSGQQQVAIEWVRYETKPHPGEPECNTYRYLFGLTSESKCVGIDVTKRPETGQIADHWTTFDDAIQRHFPDL